MHNTFHAHALQIESELVQLRRELHAHPEIGNQLPETQAKVLKALEGLPLEIHLGESLTSVVAVLRGDQSGPSVLLRGDMDGLPVTEQTGLEYASQNENMHACGHDLHTAGLVGAARLLAAQKATLKGNVVFMFQPGEEGPGGAEPMIKEGVLDIAGERVIAAYGIHVMPGEAGVFRLRTGTMMAGANRLDVHFKGPGGHASRPDLASNPVVVTAKFIDTLQDMIVRKHNTFDPVVATVTQLIAGEAFNIIPEKASLAASVRTLSHESVEAFGKNVTKLVDDLSRTYEIEGVTEWTPFYPPTINDAAETEFSAKNLKAVFGTDRVIMEDEPAMGAEDFSFVLEQVPGAFLFLNASPDHIDLETAAYNHSPHVLFDDKVLVDQATALAQLAYQRLETAAGNAGTNESTGA